MDEKERAFRKARTAAVRKRTAIINDTRAEVVRLLKLALERINAILIAQPSDYQQWYLPQLSREIERALADLGEASAARVSAAAGEAWAAGQDLVDQPLAAAGVRIWGVVPAIDTRQLFAMRAFMTDRIKDISVQAANRINTELGLTAIGAQPVNDAVKRVAQILGESSRARAFTIVRTELSRAYAVAAQERLAQAAKVVPGMRKEWRRSGKIHPRPHHYDANGQVVDYDQPFTLIGPRTIVKLMFPHDPKAPAAETINCGCVMLPRPTGFRAAEAYNPTQPRAPKGSVIGGQWVSQAALAFADRAKSAKNVHEQMDLGPVRDTKRLAAETGINAAGFKQKLDNFGLRHSFVHHGNQKIEAARGQRAVTSADMAKIPRVVTAWDRAVNMGRNKIGREVIRYDKRVGRETFHYLAEVRTKRKELATMTFYITSPKPKSRGKSR